MNVKGGLALVLGLALLSTGCPSSITSTDGGDDAASPTDGGVDAGVDGGRHDGGADGGADAGGDGGCDNPDRDGDGYMDPRCGTGPRFTDCDDDDPLINPGMREVCDPFDVDEDCNPCTVGPDADRDGYPNANCCNALEGAIPGCTGNLRFEFEPPRICGTDCNDASAAIHPGATEICNGVDDDCDGWADSMVPVLVYEDLDRDGHGDPAGATRMDCVAPTGFSPFDDDCDDTDPRRYPGALEGCNGEDDDCDGSIDEGGPGSGRPCTGPIGACAVNAATVCDAGILLCAPGGLPTAEECNGEDDDCDGFVDEALSRTCADNACGASGGTQRCVRGAWSSCAFTTFPTRACPLDGCGSGSPQTCRADGTWSECQYWSVRRSCTNACGAGVESCDASTGAYGPCVVAPGTVACPDHCDRAELGWTVSLASCSGGVPGACMGFSRAGPASLTTHLSGARACNNDLELASDGFTLYAVPRRMPTETTPCAAGQGDVPVLERGRYEACTSGYDLGSGSHPRVSVSGSTVGTTSTSEVPVAGCTLPGGSCADLCTTFETTGCGPVQVGVVVDSPASTPHCFQSRAVYREECTTVLDRTYCDRVFDHNECTDMGAYYDGPGALGLTIRRLP